MCYNGYETDMSNRKVGSVELDHPRRHGRFRRLVLLLALGVVGTAVVSAELRVAKTLPAHKAILSSPPAALQVWFNEAPVISVSKLSLMGPDGAVTLGQLRSGDERSVIADIPERLSGGRYQATWKTADENGRVVRGTFSFTIAPASLSTH